MNRTIRRFAAPAALLLAAATCAQAGDTVANVQSDTLSDTAATIDTAKSAAGREVPAIEKAEKDTAVRSADRSEKDDVILRETLDTVFIFDKRVFKHIARDWRRNIDLFRQRGYGASGSMSYGANAIFIGPVKDLVEHDPHFSNERFHLNDYGFAPFLMSGGAGYIGFGEGFRLGGGGMSGTLLSDCSTNDTVSLSTRVGYGGFLIEKAFINKRWNFSVGGMLGGGAFTVSIIENSLFNWDDRDDEGRRAAFFLFEPQAGLSYTFLYFFHVGAGITVPSFMSLDKFGPYTDDFFTVNPGLHIKLIFGNLG
ncbi:MAG: hypothetical protein JW913_12310 [Chitinispirillaceae bacterium]|nr:hypothetical protein [Chitinispirillaceae bacterium]